MPPEAPDPMEAVAFLLGEWNLDYTATQQGKTSTDLRGNGVWRRLFEEAHLVFDYEVEHKVSGDAMGGAHAVLAWDQKANVYRFHWFESSGAFQVAKGWLRDAKTLALDWLDTDCTQIFQQTGPDQMFLQMDCPEQDLHLRVDFTRRQQD